MRRWRGFQKLAAREGLDDETPLVAVGEMEGGFIDAELGRRDSAIQDAAESGIS